MLRSRVVPCLLIHNRGLVKTVNFKNPKYVGDPINAVKIFNEKEVDEIIVLDIDASVEGREPNYKLISQLAAECRMPLCYGGGVKTVQQAREIIKSGVEKVAISSALIENPELVKDISVAVGRQSVVAVLDVKRTVFGGYDIYIHNGKKKVKKDLLEFSKHLESLGIGELVINSVDNDGLMKGYDLKLVGRVRNAVDLPLTVLGGAGTVSDIFELIGKHRIIGAAAGSLFVFKGVYKAVLISYLSDADKAKLNSF